MIMGHGSRISNKTLFIKNFRVKILLLVLVNYYVKTTLSSSHQFNFAKHARPSFFTPNYIPTIQDPKSYFLRCPSSVNNRDKLRYDFCRYLRLKSHSEINLAENELTKASIWPMTILQGPAMTSVFNSTWFWKVIAMFVCLAYSAQFIIIKSIFIASPFLDVSSFFLIRFTICTLFFSKYIYKGLLNYKHFPLKQSIFAGCIAGIGK